MKKFFTVIVCLLVLVATMSHVYAGRGCCSYHGGQAYCDESVGKWVCNDGTYSPTCTCTYAPPPKETPAPCLTPSPVTNLTITEARIENSCTDFSIKTTWDALSSASGYSLSLTKDKSETPDSTSDTTDSFYSFTQKNGTYYVNIRAINTCGAGPAISKQVALDIEQPEFSVASSRQTDQIYVQFTHACVATLNISDGTSSFAQDITKNLLLPASTQKEYTFTATGLNGQKIIRNLSITPLPSETEAPTATIAEVKGENSTGLNGQLNNSIGTAAVIWGGSTVAVITGAVAYIAKRKSQK